MKDKLTTTQGAQLHLFSYSGARKTRFARKNDDGDAKPKEQQSPASHPNMQWILRQIHPAEEWDTSSTIVASMFSISKALHQSLVSFS
jgi:hypothetical protein